MHGVGTSQIRVAGRLAAEAARDGQTARIHHRRGQVGPVHHEHQVEQVAQSLTAHIEFRGFETNEFALDAHVMIPVLHRVAAGIDHNVTVARVDRRFQSSIRRETMPDLGELQELREGEQHLRTHAIRLDRRARDATDAQVDHHRLGGDGVSRNLVGVERGHQQERCPQD